VHSHGYYIDACRWSVTPDIAVLRTIWIGRKDVILHEVDVVAGTITREVNRADRSRGNST
jgi:hypothetical protein